MAKKLIFDEEVKKSLKTGVDTVANAVKITLGPRGRNVILDKGFGAPTITNDGVSIAKEISLRDKFENMGVEITKEVANKTNDLAGDGTTTAILLTQALVNEGLKRTSLGVNSMAVRSGMEKAAQDVVESLRAMATQISDKNDEIKQVATISAENEEIGAKIAEMIEAVGKDGVVTVEESQSFGIEIELTEGLEFDRGYISPYMITNSERMEAEYKDVAVLITDKKISSVQEIVPLLEKLAQSGKKELVIIAEDVEGEALATFVVNKLKGGFSVLAVKAPGYGDRKKEMLEDIAVTTGGKVVSEEVGMKLADVGTDVLGSAGRAVSTKDKTLIVNGKGDKSNITDRVESLKTQLTQTESKFDQEKLEERIAKLGGGVGVLKVGAATETEMKYLKLKIEDAINATKAAIEEGIVPGGGTSLVRASAEVAKALNAKNLSEDELVGYQIVLKALEMPLKQIAINAGKDDGSVIVEQVKTTGSNAGYDAQNDELVTDMIKVGIIDPVKVERSSVQNAVSAAGVLLTAEAAVADDPDDDKPAMPDMGGMGGGMPGMM